LERFRNEFVPANRGKYFSSEDVYRFFQIDRKPNAVEAKRALGQVLYDLSTRNKNNELEQRGKNYRIINRNIEVIEWHKAKRGNVFPLVWPFGVEDNTSFGFDESIVLYPRDLIVIAGEGNQGKTSFCLNLLVNNMDTYKCYYFSSEYVSVDPEENSKFADRIDSIDWVNPYKEDGTPKFVVAKHPEFWQDIIQPDGVNIIDWIRPPADQWDVRATYAPIIQNLNKGIAIVAIQKRSYKSVGEGGEATKDFASAYFTIRYDDKLGKRVLKVEKVKNHGTSDPNYKQFSFELVDGGNKFHDIEEVK
jgi:hypothetical protein